VTALPRLVVAAGLLVVLGAGLRRSSGDPRDASTVTPCEAGGVEGEAALERCLTLQPDDIEAMVDLGAAYQKSGQSDRAARLYRRALAVDPLDADVHLRLGRLLQRQGDRGGAREQGRVALTLRPGSVEAAGLAGLSIGPEPTR
jgi:Flp pilus assembly protein TadD